MIERDGACVSLWQDSIDPFQSREQPLSARYDVAIVGGGITGITTGLLLQKAGKNCVIYALYYRRHHSAFEYIAG